MTPRRTMAIAQQLYEGVDVAGEGAVGLITYMRTDSLRISEDGARRREELSSSAATARTIIPLRPAASRPRPARRTRTRPSVPPTWTLTPEQAQG